MIVIGTDVVERYFAARAGHRGIKAARTQYDAWRAIVEKAVFNIKGNDYRLIAIVQYAHGVLMIRFFGSHEDYDKVDAESV